MFTGRRILVTGGSRGVGLALARGLREAGAEVWICARDPERLHRAANRLGARPIRADLSEEADIRALEETLTAEIPALDLLIHNAAVHHPQSVGSLDGALARQELMVNLFAPLALTDALLPLLRGGNDPRVILISSGLAMVPRAGSAMYSATKAGLHALGEALRTPLETQGIGLTEVVLPAVDTDMARGGRRRGMPPERAAQQILRGMVDRRRRVLVGRAKALATVYRISPRLARALLS